MKPLYVLGSGLSEMFRARLDQIIDMGHEKVVPAQQINWPFLSGKCGGNDNDRPGHPPQLIRCLQGQSCPLKPALAISVTGRMSKAVAVVGCESPQM